MKNTAGKMKPIARVTRYTIDVFPVDDPWNNVYWDLHDAYRLAVEYRGDDSWAILRNGLCFDGKEFQYEPSPSNRSDAFIKRFRFSHDDAIEIALKEAERYREEIIQRVREQYQREFEAGTKTESLEYRLSLPPRSLVE